MRRWIMTICAALLLGVAVRSAQAAGPALDWDPAYAWEAGATATHSPAGGEFKMVGIISLFDVPFTDLNANLATHEYTFYVHGLISTGTDSIGPPATRFYTTTYTGGTIEVYDDATPDASFDPFPPNAGVPADF